MYKNKPVRILPMSIVEDEFVGWTIEDVQKEFFIEDLPEHGIYKYHKSGLVADYGTRILFQFQNFIIASAILEGVERYDKPIKDGNGKYYHGQFNFDRNSITIFTPVSLQEIQKHWPIVKRFCQVKQSLDERYYPEFRKTLKQIRKPKCFFKRAKGNRTTR
jgi:hypothetical protein